jgi:PKD repeat protein
MLTTAPTVLTTAPTMVPGDRVRMSGLVARADLNGKYGNVVSFDDKDGRYTVSVEGGGAVSGIVSLKPTNLSKVAPGEGEGAGEGGGAAGVVAPAAAAPSAAYTAAAAPAPAPASAAFTTSSLPASPGEWIGLWVLLGGLVSRADLNGRYGTVLSYEAHYGRWAFLMTIDGPLMAS